MISNNNQNQIKTTNNTISTKLTDDPTTVSENASTFFESAGSTGITGGTVWITLYDGDNPTASITCYSGEQTLTGDNINLIIPSSYIYTDPDTSATTIYTISGTEYDGLYGAFASSTGLISVSIPSTVTSIGNCAFRNCASLKSVTFDNENIQLESIGDNAFAWCYSLSSISIPDGIASIGDSAFVACRSLESIEIPGTVTSIGGCVFFWLL